MSAPLVRQGSGANLHRKTFTDPGVDVSDLAGSLSPFQIEKLTYLFKCLDQNGSGIFDVDDMSYLDELLRDIAGWHSEDPRFLSIVDNNRAFLECMLEQVSMEQVSMHVKENMTWEEALRPNKVHMSSISLKSWLNMWARLCRGSAGMDDFPIWVQLLPRVLFNVIVAREGADCISESGLRNFYHKFAGLGGAELDRTTKQGFKTATANGDYKLDYKSYRLLFSNYLLGKTIYGPGKYLFGVFDNRDSHEKYKIIWGEQ